MVMWPTRNKKRSKIKQCKKALPIKIHLKNNFDKENLKSTSKQISFKKHDHKERNMNSVHLNKKPY